MSNEVMNVKNIVKEVNNTPIDYRSPFACQVSIFNQNTTDHSTVQAKRVVGYARVSTVMQNTDRQVEALKNYGVSERDIFIDKMSGKDFKRPSYKRLIRQLDKNTILIIKSIDRLGRNYEELKEQWRMITNVKGADIIVLDMPIINTVGDNKLMGQFIVDVVFNLLSFVAENERNLIRERQAEGIAIARAKGIRFGREAKVMPEDFGYYCIRYMDGKITQTMASDILNMSRSTFAKNYKCFRAYINNRSELSPTLKNINIDSLINDNPKYNTISNISKNTQNPIK